MRSAAVPFYQVHLSGREFAVIAVPSTSIISLSAMLMTLGLSSHMCRLPNGTRLLLVSDPEATFAAACASVRAGYFDDPDSVPGLAHFVEHAVHLGSAKYPDAKAYKSFLSQHGGTSNASTSTNSGHVFYIGSAEERGGYGCDKLHHLLHLANPQAWSTQPSTSRCITTSWR